MIDDDKKPDETPACKMLETEPPASRGSPSSSLGRALFGRQTRSDAEIRTFGLQSSLDWLPETQRFDIIAAELQYGKDGILPVEDLLDVMGLWGKELSAEDIERVISQIKTQELCMTLFGCARRSTVSLKT